MQTKELRAKYRGYEIVVTNSWGNGIIEAFVRDGFDGARKAIGDETKLFVNGQVIATSAAFIWSSTEPILSAFIKETGTKIEVFGRAGWLRNKLKLFVNNEKVAGDNF